MDEKRRLQLVILDMAKMIIDICEKNGIQYFMDGGTHLGAVRHKGFIPWDDDLDIAMKRDQFEKFIEVCGKELDEKKYFLQTEWSEMNYCFAFAKVRLLGTHIIEDFSKNANVNHGIFVDIFPYDNIPDSKIKRKLFFLKNHILKNMIWTKCGYGTSEQTNKVKYKIFKLMGSICSIEYLKRQRDKLLVKYNDVDTMCCTTGDYPKSILKNTWFEHAKKYSFETEEFYGFEDADAFLRMSYGDDYMTLPPEKDRVQHSTYKIDFGSY